MSAPSLLIRQRVQMKNGLHLWFVRKICEDDEHASGRFFTQSKMPVESGHPL